MSKETVRKRRDGEPGSCLESLQIIAENKSFTATERAMAAELIDSFALCEAVARLTGMPLDSSMADLANAVRLRTMRLG